jgi:hypothetical protein
MMLGALLLNLITVGPIGPNAGPGFTGTWTLNDTHTFYLQENRDGSLSGSVLVRDMPEYAARIAAQPAGPHVVSGTGSQWFAPGGCVETYFSTFTMVAPNRIRVDLTGSTGACGVPTNARMTYEIRRQQMVPRPLAGRWLLGNTHVWQLSEDSAGHVAGDVTYLGGALAHLELDAVGENLYEGTGVQIGNGCSTTFYTSYALLNRNRVRVTLHGSDGGCGVSPDFHLSYDILRG